jgi:hypothetical protein
VRPDRHAGRGEQREERGDVAFHEGQGDEHGGGVEGGDGVSYFRVVWHFGGCFVALAYGNGFEGRGVDKWDGWMKRCCCDIDGRVSRC